MLSVIVPVYNVERFLPLCLDSLCNQTYRDLEIICVNDGSADNSGVILDEYAARDSRIQVIHQKNAGVSAARNAGLDAATGEFVTFVDADDWLEPDAYEKTVPYMQEGVDLVCFGTCIEGDCSDIKRNAKSVYYALKYDGKVRGDASVIINTDAGIWNKLFRMELLRKYSIYYPAGYSYGEDFAFYVMYSAVSREMYFLPEKLYHYRVHSESAMAQADTKNWRCVDHLKVVQRIYAFFNQVGLSEDRLKMKQLVFECCYAFAKNHIPTDKFCDLELLALEIGKNLSILPYMRSPDLLTVRQRALGPVARIFHWFAENRECFGILGKSIYSITYEKHRSVHRLLGRVVKMVPAEVLA